jgi:hypothetical protein
MGIQSKLRDRRRWRVEITPVVVTVQPTTTLEFSGPLILKDDTNGPATDSSVEIDDIMSGRFIIDQTDDAASFSGPDTYLFADSTYFGTLLGNGIETHTEGSADPLEVRFSNNTAHSRLWTKSKLPFISWLNPVTVRRFSMRLGSSRSFSPPFPTSRSSRRATRATHSRSTSFRGQDIIGWQVRGGRSPGGDFPDDLTSLPTTMITESSENPGTYTVVIDISGLITATFIRIDK